MYKTVCCSRAATSVFLLALMIWSAGPANAQQDSSAAKLYFFTNEGCRPCKQVEPMLERLASQGFPIVKVDVHRYPQWMNHFQITSTPTLVLVQGNHQLNRYSGVINEATVRNWFALAKSAPAPARRETTNSLSPESSERIGETYAGKFRVPESVRKNDPLTPEYKTLVRGTHQPADAMEAAAMNATVRLRVEDSEGISYATGTIIHCHNGEWLVLTCGHVFRDSAGRGAITAEHGFATGQPQSAPAQLIHYDARKRDIGLVAVRAGIDVEPVRLAEKSYAVQRGDEVFSIGCDKGNPPTIRHSRIKNQAVYDGVDKYDIFGRPVDGRSGGGLFTADGQLIGVCNAAAVDFDEGIYSAIDTVHWQLATVRLDHLFPQQPIEQAIAQGDRNEQIAPNRFAGNQAMGVQLNDSNRPGPGGEYTDVAFDHEMVPVNPRNGLSSELEVIVLVRSRQDPTRSRAITLNNPSNELLEYLDRVALDEPQRDRQQDIARLRQEMPRLDPGVTTSDATYRAQSPR